MRVEIAQVSFGFDAPNHSTPIKYHANNDYSINQSINSSINSSIHQFIDSSMKGEEVSAPNRRRPSVASRVGLTVDPEQRARAARRAGRAAAHGGSIVLDDR